MDVSSLISFVRGIGDKSFEILFCVTLLLFGFLLIPDDYTHLFSIGEFRDQYRIYLGPVTLFLSALIVGRMLSVVKGCCVKIIDNHRNYKVLKTLTSEERECLREFVCEGQNTVIRQLNDGVIGGLVAKKILYRASNIGYPGCEFNFPFNLQPWAREHLTKNIKLIKE